MVKGSQQARSYRTVRTKRGSKAMRRRSVYVTVVAMRAVKRRARSSVEPRL